MPPADKIVKVPEMAESISEGTLKQWSKRMPTKPSYISCSSRELETAKLINGAEIGDYVEQDEEIATIETDKVQFRRD